MPDYSIPNLANACRLLKAASKWDEPFRVTEAASRLGLPRTTVIRIVNTLANEGFLAKTGSTYQLGGVLQLLGLRAARSLDVGSAAEPALKWLTESTVETSHLAVWEEGRALIVRVCDSPHPLRAASRAGTRAYAHASATGKVLLAYNHLGSLGSVLPGSERKRLTSRTLVSLSALRKELQTVRSQGYAVDDEEYHEGVRCLAVPVFDPAGKVCAAIGITAAALRFPASRNAEILAQVRNAAQTVTQSMAGAGGHQ